MVLVFSLTFTLLALQKSGKQFYETVTTHLWPGLIFLLVLALGSHRVLMCLFSKYCNLIYKFIY